MQSIERYGVVALLFLVVTVVAVLVWDGEPDPAIAHAASKEVRPGSEEVARAPEGARRVTMTSPVQRKENKGLDRAAIEEEAKRRRQERRRAEQAARDAAQITDFMLEIGKDT